MRCGDFRPVTLCNPSQKTNRAIGSCRPTATNRIREFPFMSVQRRLSVAKVGDVTVIQFIDRKILDEANIQELGQELFELVESEEHKNILLNFSAVEFLSSAALGKLITLDKKVKGIGGRMKFSNIRPEIYEVFKITKLNKLFEIKDDQADALAAFAS
jgi:anti-sigma B factor antagonist